jgi:hypothetical protein
MSRFKFALATPEDDVQLRLRMAADRMEGKISVSFRREPNYFAGCAVQGESVQVIKCTDRVTGQIVGLGSRLIQKVYLNGQPTRIGYLTDLRGDPNYRRGTLLARGYQFLRQLHEADPVPFYYSLILEGNEAALGNLVGGRAGLPIYKDLGLILTPAIHLDFAKPAIQLPGVHFERGSRARLPEILAFIHQWRSQKQFTPCYSIEDFDSPRLNGFQPRNFYLAIKENRIIGTIAAWDQRKFRQTYIEQYDQQLALARPFYNLLAQFTALKSLPAPGTTIPYFYVAFIAIEDNNPEIFRALLRDLYRDRCRGPWNYFVVGLHERDPLAEVLKEYRQISIAGRLFTIYYPDGETSVQALDERVPHVEMAIV